MDEIEEEINKGNNRLRTIQEQDKEFRVEFLIELAEKYSVQNNILKETAIRELLLHEELRDTYKKLMKK